MGRCRWTLCLLADELVALGLVASVSPETVRQALKKNDIRPWIIEVWCLPPEANAAFVWRMEDVIATYQLPYDPQYPVVCFDEACKQLFGEVRPPQAAEPGRPARQDYEYERKGVCHQLVVCEPLRGWRHVRVTERRTRKDYAECLRELVDVHYPDATKIRLVQDNLNTHDGASLYEAFQPDEARRILGKLEFHYTPKHGSWLNLAESEISIMNSQCLDRRLESVAAIAQQVPLVAPGACQIIARRAQTPRGDGHQERQRLRTDASPFSMRVDVGSWLPVRRSVLPMASVASQPSKRTGSRVERGWVSAVNC